MENTTSQHLAIAALLLGSFAAFGLSRPLTDNRDSTKPTVVLVHGAFADASGWSRVIKRLEKEGYPVKAVQNPNTGFAEDVAVTKRMIEGVNGPVVLVGHSYGGAVITAAADGESNVKSLVYLAAYAPDDKEALGELNAKYGDSALVPTLVPDKAGYLTIDPAKFHAVFCADIPSDEARVMALTQKPFNSAIFGASVETAAWKTLPSWYMVSAHDQAIKPELERFMAKRMNAKTTEVKASHVAFISHADAVVKMIKEAAK